MSNAQGLAGTIAGKFINSRLTPLIIVASVLLGLGAVYLLPREEEPQIIVPMVDVFVPMAGASAKEVEERVTRPVEKLLWEVPGVEYLYSTSSPGYAMVVVRFLVGQKEEDALVRLNQKLQANYDLIPQGAGLPLVKQRSIDDVPILALTLSSEKYDPFTLRRLAAQVNDEIKQVPDVSEVKIIGGQRRQLKVFLDPQRLASYSIPLENIVGAVQSANRRVISGKEASAGREFVVEAGGLIGNSEEAGNIIIGVSGNRPVFLRNVADISDGPEEPADYVFYGNSAKDKPAAVEPAVTITVAKRKGTNAIDISDRVLEKLKLLQGKLIPSEVRVSVTRNYGETASEKSNELLWHMLIAIGSVALLIWIALGLREAGIVAIAIPVTLALTLAVFYFYGYTLNRITLFALIFSIGILVDDAIVVVENIARHYRLPANLNRPLLKIAIEAVDEVGNPTILATFAVVAAILPMAFVGGLMGPYMKPIPIGATAAMLFSLIVAFVITPWAAVRLLKSGKNEAGSHDREGAMTRWYRRFMGALIRTPRYRIAFLGVVCLLLIGALALVPLKVVTVKMLPFDNKSEFQVIIDMPEGSTLEQTASVAREIGTFVSAAPEVTDYQVYAGTAAPYNFNGLVRHYFMRKGANVADIQVNLVPKGERAAQSHDIAKRLRPGIKLIGDRYGARIKVAEVPPGPPVLQTLVAEVYGPSYERQIEVARQIRDILDKTDGVVDADWYVEDEQTRYRFVVDAEKAALSGVTASQVEEALRMAVGGSEVSVLHEDANNRTEKEQVAILMQFPKEARASLETLRTIRIAGKGPGGKVVMVPLDEVVKVQKGTADRSIYHKNLMPVVYVTADVAGSVESPVYAILSLNKAIDKLQLPEGYQLEKFVARLPFSEERLAMKWDGEWHITYEVFRDLGIAFAAVMVLIYILVVGWFQSFKTPLTIMAAIPFSLVGILPAHGAMNAFFTATSMIGFIAGAGIVVRNSIILVDFVELRLKEGMSLEDAVVDAGAVRFRPMVLTAAAVVVGAFIILFDPIFQGLAISLMAGEIASLLLSRMTVPILYYLSEKRVLRRDLGRKPEAPETEIAET